MGTVENEDPIPMVINNPITNIMIAAIALLPSSATDVDETKSEMLPVVFITSANPDAVIIMKPIIAIIAMPLLNKS